MVYTCRKKIKVKFCSKNISELWVKCMDGLNYGYDIYVRRLVSLLSEPLSLSVTVVQMDLAESSTILTIALL